MSRTSHLRDELGPGQGGITGPLFERGQKAFPNRAPIAAAADPQTSHDAAHELTASGQREAQKMKVLDILLELKPGEGLTSAELAAFYGLDRYMVARRLPDLEADSLVHRAGKRGCSITGHDAITWEAGRG